jgi:hypothetical protein
MRAITVARKPISEANIASNALKWGTGALNVDGSRVGSDRKDTRHGGGPKGTPRHRFNMDPEAQGYALPSGRWPANLILQHEPSCQKGEPVRVPGTGSRKGGEGARFQTPGDMYSRTGHEGARTDHPGHADADGMETVDSWACATECPVVDLGEQSGAIEGSKDTGLTKTPARSWKNKSTAGINRVGHSDTGTAARFFKQVQE